MPEVPKIQPPQFSPPSPGRIPIEAIGAEGVREAAGLQALAEGAQRFAESLAKLGKQNQTNRRVHQLSNAQSAYTQRMDEFMRQELLRNNSELDRWPQLLDEHKAKVTDELLREFRLDERGRQQLDIYTNNDHTRRREQVLIEQVGEQERLAVDAVNDMFEAGVRSRDPFMVQQAIANGRELGIPEQDLKRLEREAIDRIRYGVFEDRLMEEYTATRDLEGVRSLALDPDSELLKQHDVTAEEQLKAFDRVRDFHYSLQSERDPGPVIDAYIKVMDQVRNRPNPVTESELLTKTQPGGEWADLDGPAKSKVLTAIESERDEREARDERLRREREATALRIERERQAAVEREEDERRKGSIDRSWLEFTDMWDIAVRSPTAEMNDAFSQFRATLTSENLPRFHPDLDPKTDVQRMKDFMFDEEMRRASQDERDEFRRRQLESEIDGEAEKRAWNASWMRADAFLRAIQRTAGDEREALVEQFREELEPDVVNEFFPGSTSKPKEFVTYWNDRIERELSEPAKGDVPPDLVIAYNNMMMDTSLEQDDRKEWLLAHSEQIEASNPDRYERWRKEITSDRYRDTLDRVGVDVLGDVYENALRFHDPTSEGGKRAIRELSQEYANNLDRWGREREDLDGAGQRALLSQLLLESKELTNAALEGSLAGGGSPRNERVFVRRRKRELESQNPNWTAAQIDAAVRQELVARINEVARDELAPFREVGRAIGEGADRVFVDNISNEQLSDGSHRFELRQITRPSLVEGEGPITELWIVDRTDPDNLIKPELRLANPDE